MNAAWLAIGALIVLVGVRDAFMTLFQPMGRGVVSGLVARGSWRALRVTGSTRAMTLGGPIGLIAVVHSWVVMVGLGWALILWTALPTDALLASGLRPDDERGFADALYWSFTILSTLGFGDITPVADGLRIAVVAEAMLGFALLTAGLTWLSSVTSGVARARTFSAHAHMLWLTGRGGGRPDADGQADALAAEVRDLGVTLRSQPQTFFFRGPAPEDSVPNALIFAWRLARSGEDPGLVRLAAEVERVADVLAGPKFVGGASRPVEDVLRRFAAEAAWSPWSA